MYIDESRITNTLKAHRRRVLIEENHAASLVKGNAPAPEAPYPICIADLDTPCDCPSCKRYEAESMADAMASYVPKVAECDCGECHVCVVRVLDRAELAAEETER